MSRSRTMYARCGCGEELFETTDRAIAGQRSTTRTLLAQAMRKHEREAGHSALLTWRMNEPGDNRIIVDPFYEAHAAMQGDALRRAMRLP